jgi:hypothetical protein
MNRNAERIAVLAQILEDAEGCRATMAAMLLLDLPADVTGELNACDQRLSELVVAVREHVGLSPSLSVGRHAACIECSTMRSSCNTAGAWPAVPTWIAAPARAGRAPVPLVAPGGELRRVA